MTAATYEDVYDPYAEDDMPDMPLPQDIEPAPAPDRPVWWTRGGVYGHAPHHPDVTAHLRENHLPCRRLGCGCVPWREVAKFHKRRAR